MSLFPSVNYAFVICLADAAFFYNRILGFAPELPFSLTALLWTEHPLPSTCLSYISLALASSRELLLVGFGSNQLVLYNSLRFRCCFGMRFSSHARRRLRKRFWCGSHFDNVKFLFDIHYRNKVGAMAIYVSSGSE